MGLFTPYHGNYEVTFKAKTTPPRNWDSEPQQKVVVEADDLNDARRQAERKIKSNGYRFFHIDSVHIIKTPPGSRVSTERKKHEHRTTPSFSTQRQTKFDSESSETHFSNRTSISTESNSASFSLANGSHIATSKTRAKTLIIVLASIVLFALFVFGIILLSTAEERALKKECRIINSAIAQYGDGESYSTKVSQNGRHYTITISCDGSKELRQYIFTASYSDGNVDYFGTIRFEYGRTENARYSGEVAVDDSKRCILNFSGVTCSYNHSLSSPTSISVARYNEEWKSSDLDANDYRQGVWSCVKAAMSFGDTIFKQWSDKLEHW